MDTWKKAHLWIGNNHNKNFDEYFELEYYSDHGRWSDDPGYKVCGFCRDIDELWYDHDLLVFDQMAKDLDLESLIWGIFSFSDEILSEIIDICNKKGIYKANAIIFYTGYGVLVKDNQKTYNGLHYIGLFDLE